jgi:hypothetical protein
MDGGPGDDTADYSDSKYGVNVNLAAGSATTVMTHKGHITSEASMFDGENGYKALPILTVGETLEHTSGALNASTVGDYTPVGEFDGIGAYKLNHNTIRVFVNHELQHNVGNEYLVSDGQGGSFSMTGARISYFDIDKDTKAIVDGGIAYDKIVDANGDVASDTSFLTEGFDGFSRFCSGNLFECNQFGHGRGTVDTIYFAGEEDGGNFNPVGGAEWALDVETGTFYQLPALGRGAWENVTQLDTGDRSHVAFILADDTSPFDADGDGVDEAAPLYLYVGEKIRGSDDFLARNGLSEGKLYVWVPSDSSTDSPLEFNGSGSTLNGSWVELDNSRDLSQASEDGSTGYDEYGYPTQRNLWTQAEAASAFQFSRPEDIATNPKRGHGNEFVLASTGVDTFDVDPATGNGADTFGTVYTMKIDFSDIGNPVGTLKILYDGDADTSRALRSPDNVDWADNGYIYVQEDRAEVDSLTGEPLFGEGAANPNEASIVKINPYTGEVERVGHIDRGALVPGGTTDMDAGVAGAWETSGVLDVSKLFGEKPGSLFLFDVQAHGLEDQEGVSGSGGRLVDGDLVEGGQLVLLAAQHVDISQKVEVDTLANFENVIGSKKSDVLIGDAEDNVLDGNKGDDAIFGGGGNDTQIGGKGDDAHDGGEGEDTAVFSGNSEDYDIQIMDGVATVTDLRDGSPDGTDTLYNMEKAQFANETIELSTLPAFTLELLHFSDQEASAAAIRDAPNFSAVLNALRAQDLGNDGLPDNTLTLSSGDSFIPGLFFGASAAVFGSGGIADIQIQNELGVQASALGNHEFDLGTETLAGLISGNAPGSILGTDFTGAAYPYLSTNLDFSTDPNLAPLEVEGGGAPQANVVTSSVVIDVNGEDIGVVGATTPTLDVISSPGTVGISPSPFDISPTPEQLDALAAVIQTEVDALLAANPDMNKVVLLAHMQQIDIELALAERLVNVDIIVAGGSDTRLFDDNDRIRPGDSDQGQYPQFVTNAGGTTTAVVNTDGN